MSDATIYTVGGTVQASGGVYIPRRADDELLALCREGTFAYVLTPRQKGKSSLMVHTAARLAAEGTNTVKIDLTQIGVKVSAEQWYLGLLVAIEEQTTLETDVISWWQERSHLGMVQKLTLFFEKVLLAEVEGRIVVFIDEIDSTLSLDFTDDFYAAVRYLYNARAKTPEFQRLSFVLIGVASPGDLIQDPQRTPFNIGQRVDLTDFTAEEVAPLLAGLGLPADEVPRVLARILYWTGGHPYLTQRLCNEAAERRQETWSDQDLDRLVAICFFGERSEQDNNLQFVRDMLTKRAVPSVAAVLELYREVHRGRRPVPDEEQSVVKSHLKLSGVVRAQDHRLAVSNRIYREVFDQRWIQQHLPVNWARRLQRVAAGVLLTLLFLCLPLAVFASFGWINAKEKTLALEEKTRELEVALKQVSVNAEAAKRLAIEERQQRRRADQQTIEAREQARRTMQERLKAEQERWKAEEAKAEADKLRRLSEIQRLDLASVLAEKNGNPLEAQWHLAERLQLEDKPEARVRFIDLRQKATPQVQRVWATEKDHMARGPVVFSPDGQLLSAGSRDDSLRVYRASTGTVWKELKGQKGRVTQVAFRSNRKIIGASDSLSLWAWDLDEETPAAEEVQKGEAKRLLAFSPDGRKAAMVSLDHQVFILDLDSGARATLGRIEDFTSVADLDSPKGDCSLGELEKQMRITVKSATDTQHSGGEPGVKPEPAPARKEEKEQTGCTLAAFSPDARQVALRAGAGRLLLFDSDTGQRLDEVQRRETITDFVYTPNRKLTVVASNREDEEESLSLEESREAKADPLKGAVSMAYSPDGLRSAFLDREGALHLKEEPGDHADFKLPVKEAAHFTLGPTEALAIVTNDGALQLWRITGPESFPLVGQTSVDQVAFHPSQSLQVATAFEDGSIRIWDRKTGRTVRSLPGHPGHEAVVSLAYSPDGRYLAAKMEHGRLDLLDLKAERSLPISLPAGMEDAVAPLFSSDSRTLIYGLNQDRQPRSLALDKMPLAGSYRYQVMDVAYNGDGSRAAISNGRTNSIYVYEFGTGPVAAFKSPGGAVLGIALNPAAKQVASRHLDGKIRIWDLGSGRSVFDIQAVQDAPVTCMAFTPDGRILASGGEADGTLRLWDLHSRSAAKPLRGPHGRITGLAFSPDGQQLAAAGEDGAVRLWDWRSGERGGEKVFSAPARAVAWSRDGEWIAAAAQDGKVYLWSPKSGSAVRVLTGHQDAVWDLAFTADSKGLISGGEDGKIRFWTLAGENPRTLTTGESPVNGLGVAPDGRIVAGSEAAVLQVWKPGEKDPSLASGDLEDFLGNAERPAANPEVLDATFTLHDGLLLLGRKEESLSLSRPLQEETVAAWNPDEQPSLEAARLSKDGSRLALMEQDGTIQLFALGTSHPVLLSRLSGAIGPVVLSSNGKWYAYPGVQGIHVGDAGTGHEMAIVPGEGWSLRLSEDGHWLTAAGLDDSVKVWDLSGLLRLYGEPPENLLAEIKSATLANSSEAAAPEEDDDVQRAGLLEERERLRELYEKEQASDPAKDSSGLQKLYQAYRNHAGPTVQFQMRRALRPVERLRHVLSDQGAAIYSLATSPDGTRVEAAGDDGTARVWDVVSGDLLFKLEHGSPATIGRGAAVLAASFDSAGQRLVTASRDGTARVWDARTGRLLSSLGTHLSAVTGAVFSHDGRRVLTFSLDWTARLFDADSGVELRSFPHPCSVVSAAFSPDDRRVLTAGSDGIARIWDAAEGQLSFSITGHSGAVRQAEFSPDGERVATGSDDWTVKLWSARDGQLLATMPHTASISSLQFSADGKRLATADGQESAYLWDAASGELLTTLEGYRGKIETIRFSSGDRWLVTSSTDGSVALWDAQTGELSATVQHAESVNRSPLTALSPQTGRLITAGDEGAVKIWQMDPAAGSHAEEGYLLARGFPHFHIPPVWGNSSHRERVEQVAFSPDGKLLASVSQDKTARIWNVQSGETVAELEGHTDQVFDVAFSPDGARVATSSRDGTARIWEVKASSSGRREPLVLRHSGRVRRVEFSPDGKRVVTASGDRTARVWDAQSGRPLLTLRGHENYIPMASYSRDGSRIVTASYDGTARVWDAESGRQIRVLQGHSERLRSARFSPDGRQVVTASTDHTAKIWDVEQGLLFSLEHPASLWSAQFSPDGRKVATAAEDPFVRIWDAKTGVLLLTLRGHSSDVESLDFSPDGSSLASSSLDGTIRLWNVETGQLLAIYQSPAGYITTVFSPDGRYLAEADGNGGVRILEPILERHPVPAPGHEAAVRSISFSPGHRDLVTGSQDQTAKVWDLDKRSLRATSPPQESSVEAVTFNTQDEILTVNRAGIGRTWQTRSGLEPVATFGRRSERTTEPIWAAALSTDGTRLAITSKDGSGQIWDVASGRLLNVLKQQERSLYGVQISPNDKIVAALGWGGIIRTWRLEDGKFLASIDEDSAIQPVFSPDGRQLLTTGNAFTARLVDVETGSTIREFPGGDQFLSNLAFSQDGRRVLTATDEGKTHVWDVSTGRRIRSFPGFGDAAELVSRVGLNPDGTRVVLSRGAKLAAYDVESGALLSLFEEHSAAVNSISFSSDGTLVLSADWAGGVKLWEVNTGRMVRSFETEVHIRSAEITPSGREVLVWSGDGAASLWSLETETSTPLRQFGRDGDASEILALSRDGRRLVTVGRGTARVWDFESGGELLAVGHEFTLAAAPSPEGPRIVTASSNGELLVWDAHSGSVVASLPKSRSTVSAAVVSPDGRRVLAGWQDGTVGLWDTSTGEVTVFEDTEDSGFAATALALSPDGKTAAGNIVSKILSVWNTETGTEAWYSVDTHEVINAIAFSPDSRWIAAAEKDGHVMLWDSTTQQLLATFVGSDQPVTSVQFSRDGQFLVSGSADGSIRLWDLSLETRPPDEIEKLLPLLTDFVTEQP